MSEPSTYQRSFRFGPIERRGIAGGLRPGQVDDARCRRAARGRDLPTVAFRRRPVPFRPSTWCGVRGFVDRRRRPPARRMGARRDGLALASSCARGVTTGHRCRSRGGSSISRGGCFERESAALPILAGTELRSIPLDEDRELGVFHDRRAGTYTAVLVVKVRSFGLLAVEEQERRLVRWGRVLASVARDGGAVRRVQVLERTLPHDGDQLRQWLDENAVESGTAVRRSYEGLIRAASDVTQDHEVLVALQVDPRRARTGLPQASTADRPRARARTSARSSRSRSGSASSDAGVVGACDRDECARIVGQAFDPYNARETADGAPRRGRLPRRSTWDRYRTDGALHRTYWIAQWPRLAVGPAFLTPLLLGAQRRPLGLGRHRAGGARAGRARAVEAAITSDEADEELRARARLPHDRAPAPPAGGHRAPRGRARLRPRGGPLRRLRHRERTRRRRARARLRGGRAGRAAGVPRPRSRCGASRTSAFVHGALPLVPRASRAPRRAVVTPTRRAARAPGPPRDDGERCRRSTRSSPRAASAAAACYIGRDLYGGSFTYDPFVALRAARPEQPEHARHRRGRLRQVVARQDVPATARRCSAGIPWIGDPKGEYAPLAQALGVEPIRLAPGRRRPPQPARARGGLGRPAQPAARARRRRARPAARARGGRRRCARRCATLNARARRADAPARSSSCCSGRRAEMADRLVTDAGAARRAAARRGARRCSGSARATCAACSTARRRRACDLDGARRRPRPLGLLRLVGARHRHDVRLGVAARGDRARCTPTRTRRAAAAEGHQRLRRGVARARPSSASASGCRTRSSSRAATASRTSSSCTGSPISPPPAPPAAARSRSPKGCCTTRRRASSTARSPDNVPRTREVLGLTSVEAELLPELDAGVALWKVGARSFLVQHRLCAIEADARRHRRAHARPVAA